MFTILYFIFKTASQNKQQMGSGEIADQFTNLSKIGFYMECFIADVLQFLTEKPQHVAFGWPAGYFPSHPTISGILLKFPNCLIYQVLRRSATHDATHIFTFW